jgi:prepilin peptidase CpaA
MTFTMTTAGLAVLAFAGTMTFAGIRDVLTMTIANRLVLLLAAGFLIAAPLAGISADQIAWSAAAAAAVLAGAFVLFAFGWIGGGDAKLAAVAALWLGSGSAVEFILIASVFGSVLTFAVLAYRRVPLPAAVLKANWAARLYTNDSGIPYGAALAAAALFLAPHSQWTAAMAGAA